MREPAHLRQIGIAGIQVVEAQRRQTILPTQHFSAFNTRGQWIDRRQRNPHIRFFLLTRDPISEAITFVRIHIHNGRLDIISGIGTIRKRAGGETDAGLRQRGNGIEQVGADFTLIATDQPGLQLFGLSHFIIAPHTHPLRVQHTIDIRSAGNRVFDPCTGGAALINTAMLLQFRQRSERTGECILLRN